ncbi:MAG: energy transducer TonB [Acidobacteria bacterium]|nr:energy transducer TonB [Acidobacteriota bacterium]
MKKTKQRKIFDFFLCFLFSITQLMFSEDRNLRAPRKDLSHQELKPPTVSATTTEQPPYKIEPMSDLLRPTIIYREKAKYTKEARDNNVEGIVILNVVFTAEARITGIRVVRGLPHGLTEKAIEAAQKIRFEPPIRNGQPVSVRGNLEFSFQLGN